MAGVGPPLVDDGFDIFRQLAFEEYFFSGGRMGKSDGLGMEGLPGTKGEAVVHELAVFAEDCTFHDLISAIGFVIEQRMADVLHMHPDLVGAAGFQYTLNEGNIAESFEHLIVGDRFFSVFAFGISIEEFAEALVAANVGYDGASCLLAKSPKTSAIYCRLTV